MIGYLIEEKIILYRETGRDTKMKKFGKQKKCMCIAIAGMLAFGDYTACSVYAAQPAPSAVPFMEASDDVYAKPAAGTETTDIAESADSVELTDEQLAEYYGDSVFIGDSIMLGFRNYSAKQDTFVHDIQFLAVGSYSVNNALKPVKGDNIHPKYKGKKYQLWDVLPLLGKKRAFILLGMNDIAVLGLEGGRDKYKELIDKILETSPDLEIHIISVTYTLKDKGKKKLNNTNIDKYNVLLQEMAEDNGWGYIDLCTPISDGEGNLAKGCCSDGFVHLTKAAYTLWEAELINYANAMLTENEAESCQQNNIEISAD